MGPTIDRDALGGLILLAIYRCFSDCLARQRPGCASLFVSMIKTTCSTECTRRRKYLKAADTGGQKHCSGKVQAISALRISIV